MTMIDLDQATLRWFNDHAAQGILITDAQLTIRGWNQWLETHSGRTAEEMIGRNLLEAYPDLVARRLDQAYMRALAGQVVVLSQRLHHYLLPMQPANPHTTFTHMQQSVRIAPLMTDQRVAGAITVIDDVTERIEREEELKHQIAVQEALQEIDRAILTLDLQECLQRLVHHTASLVGAPIAAVLLRDDEKLHLRAYVSGERRLEVSPVDAENSVAAWAIRHGQAILIEDLTEQGSYAPPTPLDPNSQCVVAAPFIVDDEVIGALVVEAPRAHAFSDAEESLVIALATQAAIAIQNARLFEAEQRRREVAHALLEITQVASSSLELTQVLKHIAQRTAAICNASRCAIFLLNPTGERLDPVMAQFADGHVDSDLWATFKTLTAPVDAIPLLQKAIRECRPALFDDPSRTDLVPRAWSEPFGVQKLLAVPLISHDRAIGVMVLDITETGGKFAPDQIDLAVTIGGQVAASIENAQLYSRMQHMAITDSLTGLYNRRGIFELGTHEINRARRFDRPLAAIMFDLDHFKRINDTHGHPIGDQVLAGLAARCRLSLRDVDLLGRYGGEEFAVLLSETGLSDAQRVAERLRRRVAWAPFETDRGPMRVTISLGVAPLDEHCKDLTALLERADQALYAAKQAGRNQVCVWSP